MGPETLIPLLASAGGTVMQLNAQQEQAADKRRTLNRQLERDDNATDKSVSLIQDEGKRYDPQSRLQSLDTQAQEGNSQIQKDLQGGANVETAGDAGNVSADFLRTKAARAIGEGTRLTSIAQQAAKSRAPGQLQGNDALSRAGLAGSLQNIWGTNTNMARATGNDADGIEQPGYGALGGIASSIGTGMLARQIGKAKVPGVSWEPEIYHQTGPR